MAGIAAVLPTGGDGGTVTFGDEAPYPAVAMSGHVTGMAGGIAIGTAAAFASACDADLSARTH